MAKAVIFLAAVWAMLPIDAFMLPHSRQMSRASHFVSRATALNSASDRFALLFDCDGVIIETEELHRLAYNAAFKEFRLKIEDEPVEWSVAYYDILQNTGKSCNHIEHVNK